jgi:hypothetical protein
VGSGIGVFSRGCFGPDAVDVDGRLHPLSFTEAEIETAPDGLHVRLRSPALPADLELAGLQIYTDRGHARPAAESGVRFLRGDANGDGDRDLGDGIFDLQALFQGARQPGCYDAADSNDDGEFDIGDAIYLFSWLFLGGTDLPAPSVECGVDPTQDGFECESYDACR